MDYLALCNKVKSRTGISGSDLTDVTGLTGEHARLVEWVKEAWTEIQAQRRDWSFRWTEFSQSLTAGSQSYNLKTLLAGGEIDLRTGPFLLVKNSDTTQRRRIILLHKDEFDNRFQNQTLTAGYPLHACLLPDGETIRFDRTLDVAYTLSGPYYRAVQVFAAKTDTPTGLPVRYHDAIVYRAIKKWAEFEESNDAFLMANRTDMEWMDTMVRDLTPPVLVGANALA